MKKALIFLIFGMALDLFAGQPVVETNQVRFCAVDIYVDSKATPLAAYQIEFAATNGVVKIAGIEGGEHAAFREAPYYDTKAIQQDRVIIAAFSTAAATNLPSGRIRIATIHLQISGSEKPVFQLSLQTAANPEGKRIEATATFEERANSQ